MVLYHVAAPILSETGTPCGPLWWTANLATAAASLCVPLFVVVSGSLLIEEARNLTCGRFYSKRCKLVFPLIFWTALYIIVRVLSPEQTGWLAYLCDIFKGIPYYHLWYLYMLPGLYAITPLLAKYSKNVDPANRISWLAAILLLSSGFSMSLRCAGGEAYHSILTRFIPYLGYYMAGYELSRREFKKISKRITAGIAVASVGAIILTSRIVWSRAGCDYATLVYVSLSPFVITYTLSFFLLIRSQFEASGYSDCLMNKLIYAAAASAFGIYAVHPLLLRLLAVLKIPGDALHPVVAVPAVTVLVFAWSFLAVMGIRKVPFLRKTVNP